MWRCNISKFEGTILETHSDMMSSFVYNITSKLVLIVGGQRHIIYEARSYNLRIMCYLSIPTSFMPMLVTGDNSLQLFLGWEGIGLASYLFIHFQLSRLQEDKVATNAMPVN